MSSALIGDEPTADFEENDLLGKCGIERLMIVCRYVVDWPGFPIIHALAAFVQAIEQLGGSEKALVHCVAGVSRSSAVVAA